MRSKLGCFILIMIIMTSQIFAGSVYYVDSTNGNDANPGTDSLPWRTIQKAANTMVAGDSVIVKSGNYNERVSVFRSGSSDAPITYQTNGSVITRGFSINGYHVHIIGFEITNTFDDYADGVGIYIDNGSGFCQIEDCYIHDTTREGVLLESVSSNCIVRNNHIERVWLCGINIFGDNHIIEGNDISHILSYPPGYANPPGWTDADGIHIKGTGHILRENYVHDILRNEGGNDLAHIDCFQITGWAHDIVWEKNLFHIDGTDSGFQGAMIEIWDGSVSDLTFKNNIFISACILNFWGTGGSINRVSVVNNTFIGESSYVIELRSCPNAKVMNNIFYDCGDHTRPYLWHDTEEGLEVGYNLHYMSDGIEPKSTSFLPRPTDLWQINPRFVDAANYDLHLQPDSPSIDAGITLSDVTNDFDGNPRPQGAGYDIGAYEYTGASPLDANVNGSPTSGEVPLTVNFTGNATGGTPSYSYSWDFGDTTSSTEQNPSHTYSDPGDYTVILTVTDSQSNQDTDSLTINASAPATPLVASCAASSTSGEIPLIVDFTGNATGGTPPYNYNWDFGDGTSSSEQNPSHAYSQAGDYTVTLTVTDSQSNQDSDSLTISATAPAIPLEASCVASPTSGEVPLTVNFTGSATGGTPPYSYSWNFGDSTSSSEQSPSHIYSQAGDYIVTFTVTDSQSNQDSDSLTINASAPATPLVASCAASSTSGEIPLIVDFTGNATGGTPPYNYNWNFGDGTSSSGKNPSHPYSQAGDYTVTFTVTDTDSNQDTDSLIINAYDPDAPLVASCAASPTSGEVPLIVNFTGSATGGTDPYTYSWDFGDSTSSSEQNPTHTYNDAGDYTVTFTVTDSQSNQDEDSLTINASAIIAPLEAICVASPISGDVPLAVNFTGSATGGVLPYSYNWDFGDSTSSSEQNPTHTYSEAGDYTVTLTVTDSDSNQDSDSVIINASVATITLEASCAASPTSGEVPFTVNFTGIATGGVLPYSYSWDFGDGTSSSEQNPSHTYSATGDYTVYLTVTDSESNQDNDSLIINASAATNSAYLSCSPKSLYFGATTSGYETTDQYLRIINAGSGTLTWNIEDDADWLSCSPSSGTDRGEITVSVNASGLSLGLYVATITVSSPEAYNSPKYVAVNLRVYEPEQESPPFGSLDTPVNGSTVSGSVPITGWALDDIEVIRLEIKRNSDPVDPPEAIGPDGLVYIGDAVFVEGARPDVEKSYPDYPLNSRAGWGYMLLTNDLPYRGNGSFTIYGFAYDAGGHREEIGRKTILCDNINRVKPFGTIDTPEQGEIIRGSDYINFGWALTPLPKTIPKDGSTIWVGVDGVQVGHPVYDQYREDIATLYPEYNNAQGAVGYYYLDTTQYENGVHTIAWSVEDDEGEVNEIGSRYFFIDNVETGDAHQECFKSKNFYQEDAEGRLSIGLKEVRREYGPQVDNDTEINTKSILKIQIEEMEPVRIVLEESSSGNMEYIGWGENEWKDLPIGSTLDREKGIFSWIPTPGFIGRYVLHFAVIDGSYRSKPLQVVVNVIPKSYDLD